MTETKLAESSKHVFEVYIRTTPERLWQAITDGEITEKYFFGTHIHSDDWKQGSRYHFTGKGPDGSEMKMVDGEILEIDPPRKLVFTFNHHWDAEVGYPETRVSWEITQVGETCKLSVVHDRLMAGHPVTEEFFGGWSLILSGLKTYLETGEPLVVTPPSE
jgi:uncharacterized protein YndB with AHSA1/START domain